MSESGDGDGDGDCYGRALSVLWDSVGEREKEGMNERKGKTGMIDENCG